MKTYLSNEETVSLINEAKDVHEPEALTMLTEAPSTPWTHWKPNEDVTLDKLGVDAWIYSEESGVEAAQVKTYKFDEDYAVSKGWWDRGQVACIELSGGTQSACFLKQCEADQVIFYYPGVTPESKWCRLLVIEAEVVISLAKTHWANRNLPKFKQQPVPGWYRNNNRSKGSFVVITLDDLKAYRKAFYEHHGLNPLTCRQRRLEALSGGVQ